MSAARHALGIACRGGQFGFACRRSQAGADRLGDMAGGGEIEALLAAEVVGDGREIGARRFGQRARAGALEAEPPEHVDGRAYQAGASFFAAVAAAVGIGSDAHGKAPQLQSVRKYQFIRSIKSSE